MKKKLKSDLVSLAHKILKLDSESDYETLKNEAQKIYEALSVLAYIEASFDAGQPATDKAEIIKALEDENTEVIAESIQEIQQEQVEETPTEAPQKEETELERIQNAELGSSNNQTLAQVAGLSAICTVFNFELPFIGAPFSPIATLFGCNTSIAQVVSQGLQLTSQGAPGGLIIADTDGDGAFDYGQLSRRQRRSYGKVCQAVGAWGC